MSVKFKDWLLEEMRRQNITQAELSRRSGLTTAAISNYVQGRIPDKDALKKISKGLKLSADIVYRAAGLLSRESTNTATIEEILYLARQLPESELADLLDLARAKLQRHERTKGNA